MQTRKALAKLTKEAASGEHVKSPLAKYSEKFKAEYDNRESVILDKQAAQSVNLPFLNVLKKKVSKMASSVDGAMPIVATFDLYTSIRKVSERAAKDSGLKRLASHLERVWHNDPTGVLTYNQVKSFVSKYKDMFPKSAAADAIEAECSRVGMHKLPVAKLVRIASAIENQSDYDYAIEHNGLGSEKPDHVKSRAFIRGLVAMKFDAVDSGPSASVNLSKHASASDKLADRLASFDVEAGYNEGLAIIEEAMSLAQRLQGLVDQGAREMHTDGIGSSGEALDSLGLQLDEWVSSLSSAVGASQQPDVPDEIAQPLEVDVEPEEAAGLTKKWWDPRTWSYGQTAALINAAREASLLTDENLSEQISKFANRLAQLAPMIEEDELTNAPMGPPELGAPDLEMPLDMAPPMAPGGQPVSEQDVDQGVEMLRQIDDVATDIVQSAPPEALDYVEHEMGEGHNGIPGTAEWGAEEILNEGHQAPPPSEEWMNEEISEIRGAGKRAQSDMFDDLMEEIDSIDEVELTAEADDDMTTGKEAKRGKPIPMPKEEIKSQPHVTTYAKVPEDGAKALKADVIEDKILAGEVVKVGYMSIFVNDSDEIELWNRTAGRACGLEHMDTAISDFIKMVVNEESARHAARTANSFKFSVNEIVNVPCEACGTVNKYARTARKDYGCPCGSIIKRATVEQLHKVMGASEAAWQLNVQYPVTENIQDNKTRRDRIHRALNSVSGGNIKIDDEGKGFVVGTMWNTDNHSIDKLEKQLRQLGGQVTDRRRMAQEVPPAAPSAPAAPTAPAAQPAPAPGASDESSAALPNMPLAQLANAAFMNYKAQGLSLPEAMKAFLSEHKERLGEWNSMNDGDILGALAAQYTSSMPATPAPAPMSSTPAMSATAQAKMKVPSVRKPKDHVSVPKSPGKDTEQSSKIKTPSKINTQVKPKGKMSPKELGDDSETKDLMKMPSEKPRAHVEPPKGSKFPDKDLGPDSELNDNMHVPAQGAKPSIKKK